MAGNPDPPDLDAEAGGELAQPVRLGDLTIWRRALEVETRTHQHPQLAALLDGLETGGSPVARGTSGKSQGRDAQPDHATEPAATPRHDGAPAPPGEDRDSLMALAYHTCATAAEHAGGGW